MEKGYIVVLLECVVTANIPFACGDACDGADVVTSWQSCVIVLIILAKHCDRGLL